MTNEKAIMCLEDMKIKVPIPKAAKQAMENNEALDVAIKALKKEPHWIPVTERLPKDGRQVLVYAMSVHYALAKYDEMRDADGTYKKQWVTFDAWKPYYTIKDVIAWMPLPEPYKGVTT